ncbi:MAG: fibronectin type III domain-containing protein, partial [candidate division Zixibacteria bacterium]|nr:fibronectin type III domain-containing protein [candidate division Zixibacteria bacterium]
MAPVATSNSITLNWTAPGDDGNSGTASAYDIRYSTTVADWDGATQVSGEPVPQAAGSQESFVVDGLVPNTTYYFVMRAGDEVPNWSALSNVLMATTEPAQGQEAPATISNLQAADFTSTSVTLTWTAPGADGDIGTASIYDIRYSAEVADWDGAVQVTGEPSPQPSGSSESFTITGLQPGTVYFFAIMTGDEVPNWSGISNLAAAATVASDDQTDP